MRYLSQARIEELKGKACLLRTNLDIKDPAKESFRLEATLPTLKLLLQSGAKPIILSHRSRPKGNDPALSLEPAIDAIQKQLTSIYGNAISIDWVDNLRFDFREEENDPDFAKELAAMGDIYINDDFATSHRAHTSIIGLPALLPAYVGLRLGEETQTLSRVRERPEKPLVVIIGGIKIEDKQPTIDYFKDKADHILLGSAYIDSGTLSDLPEEKISQYKQAMTGAKTIIWSGPMGQIEDSRFRTGTDAIADTIVAATKAGAFSVVGGGDTTDYLAGKNLLNQFSFVSTGGGAMLDFLAGKKLPGLEALGYYG